MAFINEVVPEALKPTFDIEVFYNPVLTLYKQMSFDRWVVDHERDLFLLSLGGGGPWEGEGYPRPPQYFAFNYQGEVIKFEATYRGEGDSRRGNLVVYVEVCPITMPEHLALQTEEIKSLIKEALLAYGGSIGNPEKISAVQVTLNNLKFSTRRAQ